MAKQPKIDLRIQKTCRSLTLAMKTLLEDNIYDKITVNELCKTASIRRATFYKHFPDLLSFLGYVTSGLHQTWEKNSQSKTLSESLTAYSANMILFVLSHQKIVENLLNSKDYPFIEQVVQEQLFLGIRERLSPYRSSLSASPEIISAFYVNGMLYTLTNWFTAQNQLPPEQLLEELRGVISALTSTSI